MAGLLGMLAITVCSMNRTRTTSGLVSKQTELIPKKCISRLAGLPRASSWAQLANYSCNLGLRRHLILPRLTAIFFEMLFYLWRIVARGKCKATLLESLGMACRVSWVWVWRVFHFLTAQLLTKESSMKKLPPPDLRPWVTTPERERKSYLTAANKTINEFRARTTFVRGQNTNEIRGRKARDASDARLGEPSSLAEIFFEIAISANISVKSFSHRFRKTALRFEDKIEANPWNLILYVFIKSLRNTNH